MFKHKKDITYHAEREKKKIDFEVWSQSVYFVVSAHFIFPS